MAKEELDKARAAMVAQQIEARGITDPALLEAMRSVPRERFVSADMRGYAFRDGPLPIEAEQTISQPFIVAEMIAAAEIAVGDRVLEVGAGSGYAAAIIGQLAAEVYGIERHQILADLAAGRMRDLGYDNVTIRRGDGTKGWPEMAPFDAILVAAQGAAVPAALADQLVEGGRIVIPIGGRSMQSLKKYKKQPDGSLAEEDLGHVRFVPLVED
jgi:protein-L-isoaspartate(D-aspartate) O-methyltransferase